ncbi:MAG TPA: hypothetical protein V6C65_10405 [Allocoleopsis sp.]
MHGEKPLPASLRHLKAKLKILRRPSVLGSISILLLAAWFLGDYWQQSLNQARAVKHQDHARSILPSDSLPSDSALQPDPLDPLSSVEDPLSGEIPTLSASSALESPQPSDQPLDPSLTSLPKPTSSRSTPGDRSSLWQSPFSRDRTSAGSASSNPFSSEVPEITAFPRSSPTPEGNSWTSGNAASGNAESGVSTNPLQSALDRHTTSEPSRTGIPQPATPASPLPGSSSSTRSSTSSFNPTTPGQFYMPQPLPGQPAATQTLVQPPYVPQTSPAAGTTGYTVPPSFQAPNAGAPPNPYTPSMLPSPPLGQSIAPLQPTPGTSPANLGSTYPATAQPQFTTPQPSPAPFSVPRRAPGQSIGGGQINTFSNP